MKYSPYPEYKNTNVVWMPQIPSHWSQRRLKMVATFAYGDSLSVDARMPGDIPVYGSNGVVGTHDISNTDKPCIIIGRKGSSGKLVYSDVAGFAIDTTFFIDKRTTDAELKWLYYVLQCLKLDEVSKDSAVPGLAREDAYQYIIPWTEIDEQKKIANFLDYKTQQIDQLIEKKKALIEKLNEQRIAVITRAVTKGLDETVPMKDSGVDWLGQVPEHWDVRRLKFVTLFVYGDSLSSENRVKGDVPVFGSNGIVGEHDCSNTKAPCIIVGRKGSHGKLVFSDVEGFAIDTTYYIDERTTNENLRWLYYVLLSLNLDSISKDSAVPGLSREDAYQNFVPWTGLDEQKEIAKYIDRETKKIDDMVKVNSAAIERLEEYRVAMITAAVTGKIDVRSVLC